MNAPSQTPPPDEMLREYYHLHFAGRPRITRNVALLSQLIALAGRNQNTALQELWRKEQALIESEQQAAGSTGRQMALYQEEGQIAAYRLQFLRLDAHLLADAAVDVTALDALIHDVAELAQAVQPLAKPQEPHSARATQLVQALAAVGDEAQQLVQQAHNNRRQGPLASRAQACVRAAQLLQHTFDTRVAGQSGSILRPERMAQLADGLMAVAKDLSAVPLGLAEHEANCQGLVQQASSWRAQAQKVSALRRQHTPDELAHLLGAAADDVLEAAQGWMDAEASAARAQTLALGIALCDRMDEIRRQLVGVPLIYGLTEHQHTLGSVTDGLAFLSVRLQHSVGPAERLAEG